MKKIFILLLTAMLLSSCFWGDAEETPDDIVSNIVDVQETSTWSDSDQEEDTDDWESDLDEDESSEESDDSDDSEPSEPSEPIVSGSDNDPRVNNTQGEWTNPPETQSPSVPTENTSSGEEEIIKDFEAELDSLFDLLESDEG